MKFFCTRHGYRHHATKSSYVSAMCIIIVDLYQSMPVSFSSILIKSWNFSRYWSLFGSFLTQFSTDWDGIWWLLSQFNLYIPMRPYFEKLTVKVNTFCVKNGWLWFFVRKFIKQFPSNTHEVVNGEKEGRQLFLARDLAKQNLCVLI